MMRPLKHLPRGLITLGIATALHGAQAQSASPAPDLAALFYEDTVGASADGCAKRMPASKAAWASAVQDWQHTNSVQLAALRQLVAQVDSFLSEPPTTPGAKDELAAQVQTARKQAVALPLQALAFASDGDAGTLCLAVLDRLADAQAVAQQFASARAVAKEVLGPACVACEP